MRYVYTCICLQLLQLLCVYHIKYVYIPPIIHLIPNMCMRFRLKLLVRVLFMNLMAVV